MGDGEQQRQQLADQDPRELCPLDLSALTPGPFRHVPAAWAVAVPIGLLVWWAGSEAVGLAVMFAITWVLALWRAVRVADSVSVFHRALDDGWLQVTCSVSERKWQRARPGVLTIANGKVAIDAEIHEEWPATVVGLEPAPDFWKVSAVTLTTPAGDRLLCFVSPSDQARMWASVVDRQAHTAVSRALKANRWSL